jgi:hypothetical protein
MYREKISIVSLLLQQPFLEGIASIREKEGKRRYYTHILYQWCVCVCGGFESQQRLADGVMARAPEDLDQ